MCKIERHITIKNNLKINFGFTIVELVVVISVIGILSSMVLLNYGKWQETAVIAKLKSDLNSAAAALENKRTYSNSYPSTLPTTSTGSEGVELIGGSTDGGRTYCVSAKYTQTGLSYYFTSDNKTPRVGECNLSETLVSVDKNINTGTLASSRTCADAVSYSVISMNSTSASLSSIPASGCLAVDDEVLLINLQGTTANNANVGNYETIVVQSIIGSTVNFKTSLTKYYGNGASDYTNIGISTTNQRVMLQRVPIYTDFSINAGSTVTANAWNGVKGGVIFIKATGTISIMGTIDMTGKGWRGGAGGYWCGGAGESYNGGPITPQGAATSGTVCTSSTANGGGGGGGGSKHLVDSQTGGAGGAGYAVAGTNGGTGRYQPTLGYGGSSYGYSNLSSIYFGSGGGGNAVIEGTAMSGGNGGGIIIIYGNAVSVTGSIKANGTDGYLLAQNSSAGSGGSIYINSTNATIGSNLITAKSGISGNSAPWNGTTVFSGGSGPSSAGRIRIVGSVTGVSNPAHN